VQDNAISEFPKSTMKWLTICTYVVIVVGREISHDIYREQALKLLEESPLVDTHVDLPQIIRSLGKSPCVVNVPAC
jgi:hypothetical protein